MSDVTTLLARYDTWHNERSELHGRDGSGEHPVSSSEWQGSDDEGAELAIDLAAALRAPREVWTAAVKTPYNPTPVATVHKTEGECFEHLREYYDPEGDADDEPPVAIVSHLEEDGYYINVDVHQL